MSCLAMTSQCGTKQAPARMSCLAMTSQCGTKQAPAWILTSLLQSSQQVTAAVVYEEIDHPNCHALLQKKTESTKRGFIIASIEKTQQDKEKNAFKTERSLITAMSYCGRGQLSVAAEHQLTNSSWFLPSSLIAEQNIGLKTELSNESSSLSMSLAST
ncbi:hypothetical protein COCNU_02G009910 [Cocos nucifera]|uniref:Uncharacterized protein n=1 Tax=Cocos nucifera TaxID=13894 RepID=A0A8K0MX35_COCNU|nr:hypothetical protein COCNU_02G009910 [Cocos nucifera]